MDRVALYYMRMLRENDPETAMAFTLEMFEGLTEAAVDHALERLGR